MAQINKPGANFELVERDIPEPGPGEVRIKVEACGIGSSSSFAKYLPVRGPRTVTTTHLSFCGARVISSSRPSRGEDTKRNLKHVKDRAANLAERPQRVSSVTRIKSTVRACANARTFLRSARSCFGRGRFHSRPRRFCSQPSWQRRAGPAHGGHRFRRRLIPAWCGSGNISKATTLTESEWGSRNDE